MKTLIYCPTWKNADGTLAVLPQTRKAIEAQGADKVVYGTVNPYPGYDQRNVTAQYEAAWKLMLKGNFDALLTVEHDMEPPADALAKLAELKMPVTFGVYLFRQRIVPVLNAYRIEGKINTGMSFGLFPKECQRARKQKVVPVSGVGWGCTLIMREVIEHIPVHGNKDGKFCDGEFAIDCLRALVPMFARFDVECGHWYEGKKLMPFEVPDMLAVECLVTFTGKGFGPGSRKYEAGKTYKLPEHYFDDYRRAGYMRVLE